MGIIGDINTNLIKAKATLKDIWTWLNNKSETEKILDKINIQEKAKIETINEIWKNFEKTWFDKNAMGFLYLKIINISKKYLLSINWKYNNISYEDIYNTKGSSHLFEIPNHLKKNISKKEIVDISNVHMNMSKDDQDNFFDLIVKFNKIYAYNCDIKNYKNRIKEIIKNENINKIYNIDENIEDTINKEKDKVKSANFLPIRKTPSAKRASNSDEVSKNAKDNIYEIYKQHTPNYYTDNIYIENSYSQNISIISQEYYNKLEKIKQAERDLEAKEMNLQLLKFELENKINEYKQKNQDIINKEQKIRAISEHIIQNKKTQDDLEIELLTLWSDVSKLILDKNINKKQINKIGDRSEEIKKNISKLKLEIENLEQNEKQIIDGINIMNMNIEEDKNKILVIKKNIKNKKKEIKNNIDSIQNLNIQINTHKSYNTYNPNINHIINKIEKLLHYDNVFLWKMDGKYILYIDRSKVYKEDWKYQLITSNTHKFYDILELSDNEMEFLFEVNNKFKKNITKYISQNAKNSIFQERLEKADNMRFGKKEYFPNTN